MDFERQNTSSVMPSILIQVTWIFTVLGIILPLGSTHGVSKLAPTPPLEDPFYTPPAGYKHKLPGTILRYRVMPDALIPIYNMAANLESGFEILYRTTDALGNAQATVTTLLIPNNACNDKLLSYQTFEDSAYGNCAPSYGLEQGSVNGIVTVEMATIGAALYQGWYVNVPDYEGPKSVFTVGPQAAHATLDSIRAVLQSGQFSNLSSQARTAMWGYSGGALATEWAAEFLSSYAPELHIVGAAAGGVTPNITSVLLTVNKGANVWQAFAGLNGFGAAFPAVLKYINAKLIPSMAAAFRTPLTECSTAITSFFANQDFFSYFKNGAGILEDTTFAAYVDLAGIMGQRGTPSVPLYFYKALADEISPIAETDALYKQYCSDGGQVTYQRNAFGEHSLDFIFGTPGALSWLKDRLDGVETSGCSVDNVTISTIPSADAALLGPPSYAYYHLILEVLGLA